jgi:hypothetical protein
MVQTIPFQEGEAARRPVVAVVCDQLDAGACAVRLQAEAVVLDLVDPARAGRRRLGKGREAGLDGASVGARGRPKSECVQPSFLGLRVAFPSGDGA